MFPELRSQSKNPHSNLSYYIVIYHMDSGLHTATHNTITLYLTFGAIV